MIEQDTLGIMLFFIPMPWARELYDKKSLGIVWGWRGDKKDEIFGGGKIRVWSWRGNKNDEVCDDDGMRVWFWRRKENDEGYTGEGIKVWGWRWTEKKW